MEDSTIKRVKEELNAQLNSYRLINESNNIPCHLINTESDGLTEAYNKFENILSAKNEWESCVDCLEQHAIIVLDDELNIIRTNRTVELWGWSDVKDVRGTHILNLIKPAIEHDLVNDWLNEWCRLDTQSNVEWISRNYIAEKTFHFSFFPNRDIESRYHDENYYAVMLISDITNQKSLTPKLNDLTIEENRQINSNLLNKEKEKIKESEERLHQMANKLIGSQEAERKRISSELHDGIGQLLSALKYQVESVVIESNQSSKKRKDDFVLNNVLNNITTALSELRQISVDLRPTILDDLGLLMTLRWFVNEYTNIYTELNVELHIDMSESDITDEHKNAIYRIVQESMNNIAKHANAKNIYVHLIKSDSGVLLRVTDDGCGFDIKKIKRRKRPGVGLESMEERAVNSGGEFKMSACELSGTVIQVYWQNI